MNVLHVTAIGLPWNCHIEKPDNVHSCYELGTPRVSPTTPSIILHMMSGMSKTRWSNAPNKIVTRHPTQDSRLQLAPKNDGRFGVDKLYREAVEPPESHIIHAGAKIGNSRCSTVQYCTVVSAQDQKRHRVGHSLCCMVGVRHSTIAVR